MVKSRRSGMIRFPKAVQIFTDCSINDRLQLHHLALTENIVPFLQAEECKHDDRAISRFVEYCSS